MQKGTGRALKRVDQYSLPDCSECGRGEERLTKHQNAVKTEEKRGYTTK
jgi:hypothetical protein